MGISGNNFHFESPLAISVRLRGIILIERQHIHPEIPSVYLDPDEEFYGLYHPDSPKNQAGVDDPELTVLILAQQSEGDVVKRNEIFKQLQKLTAVKQYNWYLPSYTTYNAFPPWLKNVGAQKKNDVGGMWLQAWLTEDAPGRQ